MERKYRLIIDCPDQVGIVAAVSQFIAQHGGWILDADHHSDRADNWFYMRYEIQADSLSISQETLVQQFNAIANQYQMNWKLTDSQQPKRVALLATKASHCLLDILHRWKTQELDCEIACVISNHSHLAEMVSWYNVPYYHQSIARNTIEADFDAIFSIVEENKIDTIVLARFMQVIPEKYCTQYQSQIINIHHSFLPSFAGAKPYHHAFKRGVKLIGATCHYVTNTLDEGPIIEQDVIRVSHRDNEEDMLRLGRDVEKTVLAKGFRYHLEDRILVKGNKTVILI